MIYAHVLRTCLVHKEARRGYHLLELKLQVVVSRHVGAGNETQVWEDIQISHLLSYLYSPQF